MSYGPLQATATWASTLSQLTSRCWIDHRLPPEGLARVVGKTTMAILVQPCAAAREGPSSLSRFARAIRLRNRSGAASLGSVLPIGTSRGTLIDIRTGTNRCVIELLVSFHRLSFVVVRRVFGRRVAMLRPRPEVGRQADSNQDLPVVQDLREKVRRRPCQSSSAAWRHSLRQPSPFCDYGA